MEDVVLKCYNLVKDNKKLSIRELESLLREKNPSARKKFVEGYLPSLFRLCYNLYQTYKITFNNRYTFEDFFGDAVNELIILYNEWKYDNAKDKYENLSNFTYLIRHRLLSLLPKTCFFNISYESWIVLVDLLKQKEDYYRDNGINISNDELLKSMGWNKKVYNMHLDIKNYDDLKMYYDNIDAYIDKDFDREAIRDIIKLIEAIPSERTKKIIYEYYGMYYFDQKSIQEIGKEIGLTRQMVNYLKKLSMDPIKDDEDLKKKYVLK